MTDKAPKWKRAGNDGEIEIKFPTGRRFKVEKQYDHNIRHKGEWKVMEWDTRTRDWEWADTYSPKAYAKEMAMKLGQYKNGKKVADYSHTFQYESTMHESVKPHPEVVKAYKKTLDADHRHGEYGTVATKRAMTRTANTLSKKIKQHHPDLDMNGKIAIRTALQNMKENFMDGRNPQDKGDSKRHGIPKKATLMQLKKIRSSETASPRKKQLAHWQINMRKGKQKANEEMMTTGDAGIPQDTRDMGPRNMTDRRRRKDKPPVLLKRFRKYMEDNG